MIIDLFDRDKKEDVRVILENINIIPSNDLYVVFMTKDTVCYLEGNIKSSPYNEYLIKKVSHCVNAITNYKGNKYSLTLGFYFSGNENIPFLLDQRGYTIDDFKFENSSWDEDINSCDDYKIFNYKEYTELCDFGFEKLSFKEYVIKFINGDVGSTNKLYTLQGAPKDFLTEKEFETFLNQEEKSKCKK